MKLIFGAPASYERYCTLPNNPVINLLGTQIDKNQIECLERLAIKRPKELFVMIDSGAFSVWSSGKTMTKEALLPRIREIKSLLEPLVKEVHFVGLDIIPGTKTRKPTALERVEAAEEGWKNYLWFKQQGVENLIHVYHQYEPLWVLQRMLDNGCKYIGISPDNLSPVRLRWLEHVFKYIPEKEVKTHGFGVTSYELVQKIPWYSVDSISYALTAAYGFICVFYPPLFGAKLQLIKCSERSKKKFPIELEHRIEQYLESLGPEYTFEAIAKSSELRVNICILAYLNLEKYCNENPPTMNYKKQSSVFDF